MERFVMNEMVRWMNKPNRKPLILKGARQVGKTWLMKSFGERNFEQVAYINFDNNPRMKKVFDDDYDVDRILMAINIETKKQVNPLTTLIIFDEIQEAPRAISSLKYFYENAPEYAIVAAGSLLGAAIHHGVSFPVGKVDTLQIDPMNFREFLYAVGEKPMADLLEKKDYALIKTFESKYADWLKKYYFVGGMPEAVNWFIKTKDFYGVREIQKTILELYENDFSKHTGEGELPRIRMVWNAVPMQLAKENKKFFFGQIKQGARSKDFELAIEWLLDCGLIKKVFRVKKPGIPLKAYIDFSAFKIYLLDVGLLCAMSDVDAKSILNGNEIFTEFKGAMTEQYALQQILSESSVEPYYFTESEHNEIDFVVQKEGLVVPIEVNSEENLQAKSLRSYCSKYHPGYAVRTSMSSYREEEWMVNLPLYAICNL